MNTFSIGTLFARRSQRDAKGSKAKETVGKNEYKIVVTAGGAAVANLTRVPSAVRNGCIDAAPSAELLAKMEAAKTYTIEQLRYTIQKTLEGIPRLEEVGDRSHRKHEGFHSAWKAKVADSSEELAVILESIKGLECVIMDAGLARHLKKRSSEYELSPEPAVGTGAPSAFSEGICCGDAPPRRYPCKYGFPNDQMDLGMQPESPISGSKRGREDDELIDESPRKSPKLSEDSPKRRVEEENEDADVDSLMATMQALNEKVAQIQAEFMLFLENITALIGELKATYTKLCEDVETAGKEYGRLCSVLEKRGLARLVEPTERNVWHACMCLSDSTSSGSVCPQKNESGGADADSDANRPKAAAGGPAGASSRSKTKTRRGGNVRRAWQQVTGALGKFGRTLLECGCGSRVFEGMDESDGEVVVKNTTTGVVDMAL